MIVVRVELHSAVTGKVTELGRMHIANDGTGTASKGHYDGYTIRGRSREALDVGVPQRRARVENYSRESQHVWNLVSLMLKAMGYK